MIRFNYSIIYLNGNKIYEYYIMDGETKESNCNSSEVHIDLNDLDNTLRDLLTGIVFEDHTAGSGPEKEKIYEAAYFSVQPGDTATTCKCRRIYIDTSRNDNTLYPYQLYDGFHDKTIGKSIKDSTEAKPGGDGKKRIQNIVFREKADDEEVDSALSTSEYTTTHINIWHELPDLYTAVVDAGEDEDLFDSLHRFETLWYELEDILIDPISTDRVKKNAIISLINDFLGDLDYIYDKLIVKNHRTKFVALLDLTSGTKFEDYVEFNNGEYEIADNGFFDAGGTKYTDNVTFLNYMGYTFLPLLQQWRDKFGLFDWDGSIFKFDNETGVTESFIMYPKYREVMQGFNSDDLRRQRRNHLLELFSNQQMARDVNKGLMTWEEAATPNFTFKDDTKHPIVLDNGVSGSINTLNNIINAKTAGKIFDMKGSNGTYTIGTAYPSDDSWKRTGFIIAIKCFETRFILFVRGGDDFDSTKADIGYLHTDTIWYFVNDLKMSSDKKKVSTNAIYQKIKSIGGNSGKQKKINTCCAALIKHAGDIGMLLNNIAIFCNTGDNIALATHDSWLMYAATHCSFESCHGKEIEDRRELYIPVDMLYSPSPKLSSPFVAFSRLKSYPQRNKEGVKNPTLQKLLSQFRIMNLLIKKSSNDETNSKYIYGPHTYTLIMGSFLDQINKIKRLDTTYEKILHRGLPNIKDMNIINQAIKKKKIPNAIGIIQGKIETLIRIIDGILDESKRGGKRKKKTRKKIKKKFTKKYKKKRNKRKKKKKRKTRKKKRKTRPYRKR